MASSLVEGLGLETLLSPSGVLPRDPKMQPHPCTHPTPELGRDRGTKTGLGWGCCSGEVFGKIVSSSPRAGTQVVTAKSVLYIWLISGGKHTVNPPGEPPMLGEPPSSTCFIAQGWQLPQASPSPGDGNANANQSVCLLSSLPLGSPAGRSVAY